jgi:hypothetical protein
LTVRGDWETGDNSQFSDLECANPSSQFAVVTSPVRQGRYAARFSEGPSDVWLNGSVRCLDALYDSGETTGDTYYYGLSVYLPQSNSGNLIWELHQPYALYSLRAVCSVAPLALNVSGTSFSFRIMTGNCDGTGASYYHPRIPVIQATTGEWVDFAFRISFAERATGSVDAWARVQGQPWPSRPQIHRRRIPTMLYSNAANLHNLRLYTAIGLYPGGGTYTGHDTIYLDNYTRGTTFASVTVRDAPAQSPLGREHPS